MYRSYYSLTSQIQLLVLLLLPLICDGAPVSNSRQSRSILDNFPLATRHGKSDSGIAEQQQQGLQLKSSRSSESIAQDSFQPVGGSPNGGAALTQLEQRLNHARLHSTPRISDNVDTESVRSLSSYDRLELPSRLSISRRSSSGSISSTMRMLSKSDHIVKQALELKTVTEQRQLLWSEFVTRQYSREINGEQYVTMFEVNFDLMMEKAKEVDSGFRQQLVANFNQFGLERGGSSPLTDEGRGVFSDEDLQCGLDTDASFCNQQIRSFISQPQFNELDWQEMPLYFISDALDIIIWKNDEQPDFCAPDNAWESWMKQIVAEKEKSYVGWAQYTGQPLKFSPLEVILEMMSKSRYYLRGNAQKWYAEGALGWDHFAQFAKALDRMQSNLAKLNFPYRIEDYGRFTYKQYSKMFVGPCQLGICDGREAIIPERMIQFYKKFIKHGVIQFATALSHAIPQFQRKYREVMMQQPSEDEAKDLLRSALRIINMSENRLVPRINGQSLFMNLIDYARKIMDRDGSGNIKLQAKVCSAQEQRMY
ncbi:hypothetical protein MIR68_010976 [Amoeboaphelidium protococcarum]|nr:hypothetical protein MIR68_010976 [Amoeboaphelidium protococcarum]